jgi:hypothetical protein
LLKFPGRADLETAANAVETGLKGRKLEQKQQLAELDAKVAAFS